MQASRKNISICLMLISAAGSGWAQMQALGPFDPDRGLPQGFQITQASIYSGGYDFRPPETAASQAAIQMAIAGGSASVGWYFPGDRSQAFVSYDVGYNANLQYHQLNGLDQVFKFGLRRKLVPRVILSLDAVAQSMTFNGFLFQAPAALEPPDTLSGAVGDRLPTTVVSSPIALAVFGTEYRAVTGGATLTFLKSPRLEWTFGAHASRLFPTETNASAANSQILPEPLFFEGATSGEASAGVSYSATPLTTISLKGDYLMITSGFSRDELATLLFGVKHTLSRHWFVHTEGGPGALREAVPGEPLALEAAYHANAGIGLNSRGQLFSLAAYRDSLDLFGFGETSTGGDFAWNWSRADGSWSLRTTAGYARLQGGTIPVVEAWIGGITISHQLSLHTKLVLHGVYTSNQGYAPIGLGELAGTGVRMSYVWAPVVAAKPKQ